jgi:hypothetical protein
MSKTPYKTCSLPQFHARAHKSESRENRLLDSVSQPRKETTLAMGTERQQPFYAKGELYGETPSFAPGAPIPYKKSCHDQVIHDKVPKIDQRESIRQIYSREFGQKEKSILDHQKPPVVSKSMPSIIAVNAEKEAYKTTQEEENKEAYAHVKALQKSLRGFTDTAEATIEKLKLK